MDQIVLIFLEGGNKKMEVYPLYWSSAWTRLFCRWWWNHIFSDYVPVYSRFWAPATGHQRSSAHSRTFPTLAEIVDFDWQLKGLAWKGGLTVKIQNALQAWPDVTPKPSYSDGFTRDHPP
jgi:hypothetical protein